MWTFDVMLLRKNVKKLKKCSSKCLVNIVLTITVYRFMTKVKKLQWILSKYQVSS